MDASFTTDLRLAPSILSADFARLASEIEDVAGSCDMLHVDIMDGHYVPNLTIGPDVVRSLRAVTDLPFDTHLMITDPRTFGPQFVKAGSTSITFHPTEDDDPRGLIQLLHDQGAEVGIAIRPSEPLERFTDLLGDIDLLLCMTVEPGFGGQAFMPEVLPKIELARSLREEQGHHYRIEVDGGIDPDTAPRTVSAGADTLVAGSAIFRKSDRAAAARAILDAAGAATADR
ncbi:MAG: ribulose-phosphate 3-epimerase [Actinobacteria bacterium]|nr:ribulose-phosphate 3-epimerase [Actinomycetota bacterium]